MAVAFLLLVAGSAIAIAGLTASSGVFTVVGALLIAAAAIAFSRATRKGGGQ